MTASAIGLFDRLPPNIFAILHGANARRAWELLERLAIQYFGPDSELPYPDGYLHSDITKEIERFLLDKEWEIDDSEGVGQSINIKANYLLARLVESGWLCEDKVGGRFFFTMKPVVSRFFEMLHQFAAEGPPMIGGNIQVVHAQMKSVVENPREQAAGFVTAAKLCTQLIGSLNSTAFRVRDLMQEIVKEKEIHLFVGRFFAEHISQIYIRDFKELRTENHPLRHRMDILALVDEVARNEPSRSLLLQGYRDLPGTKIGEEEEMLERDIERFHRLMTIEGFLDRMDRIIETVYQRANAYLAYRLKATERIEAIIADTIDAATRADGLGLPIEGNLLSPRPLVNEAHLYLPPQHRPKPAPPVCRKREMTPTERALHQLRKIMIANRDTSAAALRLYVEQNLPEGVTLSAADLPTGSVKDLAAQMALSHLAAIAAYDPDKFRNDRLLRNLGFVVERVLGERVDTEFFNMPNFTVRRERKSNAT